LRWQREKDKADEKQMQKRVNDKWMIAAQDKVWLRVQVRGVFQPRWEGPYVVVSVSIDGLILKVKRVSGHKQKTVHRSHVMPYHEPNYNNMIEQTQEDNKKQDNLL
jgi:hypothetical protein